MGILDSDFVKFGVEILTNFLEILNKVTAGLGEGGFLGGLTKIMTVLGIFKMGMKIFEKFRAPLITFFAEIVKEAGLAGERSGQSFSDGV
jgi:hypothetical protein